MSKFHRVTLFIRFPDGAVGKLQRLGQLHKGGVEDSVTIKGASNLIRQHTHIPPRLFLVLDEAHFSIELRSFVLQKKLSHLKEKIIKIRP
jgi:hypothetical protein